MTFFDRWLCLALGIFFIITSIVSMVSMIRNRKKRAAWWRWALDIFGIIWGAWFIFGFFM